MSQSAVLQPEKTLGGGSSGGAGSNAMSDVAKGHQAKSPKSKIPTNLGRDGVNVEASPNGSVDDATKKGSLRVNSGSRRTVPKSPIPSARRASSAMSQQRKVLETQLSAKKKRYQMMKNELINNQKKTQVIYDEMMQLREKVLSCGGNDSGPIEEIKFMDTRGPRHSENRSGAMSPSRDNFNKVQEKEAKIDASEIERNEQELENSLITKNFLDRLEMIVREIPTKYQEFCQFALEKYFNIATFLTALAESNKTDDGSASVHSQRIEEYRKDTDVLKKRFEEINEDQTKLTDDLLASFYNLYEEYSGYRTKLKELNTIVKAQKEICDRYENSQMDLQAEQERKDQKTQLENQMAVARAKIRELESQLSKSEYKFQQMQANFKKSEEQHRCKEQTMDKRLKDMQKTLKNNETLVSTVETQRDTYEKRLLDLREKMSVSEAETANKMSQMNDRLNSIMDELENEKEKRREAEAKALSAEERNKKMEEKCQELCDMAQKKDYSISENKYSQKEIFLYNDLKNTRKELEEYKEKLKQVQNEKEEILSMMHQAAVEDDDDETKSKLAAELAVKSESLRKLATQCMKLEHELSIAKQRNDNLERQVTDIQKRLHAQMSDNGKNASIAHTIELQQQISELREALIEEQNHNKDIEKELLQKQLEVEERDRALREGSKILELREELLSIMNAQDQSGLETPEISESYSDMEEIDKQAWSKTKIIQDLHSRLENKQLQVMQLEKMVKQMEDQQDRAQAQRTRLESRIADLELSLQEKTRESRYVDEQFELESNCISTEATSLSQIETKETLTPATVSSYHSCSPPEFPLTQRRHIDTRSSSDSSFIPDNQGQTQDDKKLNQPLSSHYARSPATRSRFEAPTSSECSFICEVPVQDESQQSKVSSLHNPCSPGSASDQRYRKFDIHETNSDFFPKSAPVSALRYVESLVATNSRQTASSDEKPAYICESCRREDVQDTRESFYKWLMATPFVGDRNPNYLLDLLGDALNKHDASEKFYPFDSTDKDFVFDPVGARTYDGSRESRNLPKIRTRRRRRRSSTLERLPPWHVPLINVRKYTV